MINNKTLCKAHIQQKYCVAIEDRIISTYINVSAVGIFLKTQTKRINEFLEGYLRNFTTN